MNFLTIFENDIKVLFPELFLTISILALLMYGVVYSTSSHHDNPIIIRATGWLSIQILFLTILLLINNPIHNQVFMNNLLVADYFGLITKIVLLISSSIAIIISFDYIKKERINSFEYMVLVLLGTLGMLLIISSYDLMSMYLAIEFQSLCLYVLAAFKRNSLFSVEAGLKYFVLGAFSSGIMLFGISILYGFTGVTGFEDLGKLLIFSSNESLLSSSGIILGIVFISVGLLFKIYAVPFHVWVPDVYQGSPTIVTAFFAIVPSISVLTLLTRLYSSVLHDLIQYWQPVFIFCSIASMLIGSLGALSQRRIKRLLAYSAIGHVGYVLIALSTGTPEGIRGLLVYIVIYIIMSACFFTILLSLRKRENNTQIVMIDELRALYKSNPILSLTLAIVLFSMAGIPPLAGFFSKLYVFLPAIHEGLFLLVVVGIIASVISAVYYLGLIKIMYFDKLDTWVSFEQVDKQKAIVLGLTTFLILFFFIYPSPLVLMSHKAALMICL
uniref:NADH dehydrogenase subunit 2 n=1 Tax=Reclinomonas americana TaxID=48483 RepID=O21287_RECAM|nr:NADH dehydrogenase subunit 2 [Reclinomonas americana]AAD11917.1 NADH dehydrogenase subunit 2 [Reclinomonas americana]